MKSLICTLSLAACGTTLMPSLAADKAAAAAKPAASAATRQITWEELLPKDWDPMKDLKGIDLASLDDADPRAAELLTKLQNALNNAPTHAQFEGQAVRLPGYVVPLDEEKGGLVEFLLVPYFGACIHTPPPPANQIVHVRPRKPVKFRAMDTVWISGRLQSQRNDSMMGTSGYSMQADSVTPYADKK